MKPLFDVYDNQVKRVISVMHIGQYHVDTLGTYYDAIFMDKETKELRLGCLFNNNFKFVETKTRKRVED